MTYSSKLPDSGTKVGYTRTMPLELIAELRRLVSQARSDTAGLWPHETLTSDNHFNPRKLSDLRDLVIVPRLHRRLTSYFRKGHVDLTEFDAWVRGDPINRDDRALLPT